VIKIDSKDDILVLKESFEVEFKKATGKNGKGKLPNDFLESYSAMANTSGGNIFLGIEENGETINLVGIKNPEEVIKELFDTLNNPQKINLNILKNEHIQILEIEQKNIIWIKIPKATRKQRPIYKGQNPLTGTFIRQGEGDYKCKEECVKRFLAEQIEDSRDSKVLKSFDFDDIELSTFYAYRNIFKSHKPDHPFNALSDLEFLKSIGGYKKDRESGEIGLTIAGLLMFGKQNSIEEALPYYMVDYQERPRAVTEKRWIDRVYPDGTWSGNIFDFYRKVIAKLYENLKIPFSLKESQREEDTPIHQAIREALINALVHADYSERLSILIVK
jgi:predicted HTH transcriptional regulator